MRSGPNFCMYHSRLLMPYFCASGGKDPQVDAGFSMYGRHDTLTSTSADLSLGCAFLSARSKLRLPTMHHGHIMSLTTSMRSTGRVDDMSTSEEYKYYNATKLAQLELSARQALLVTWAIFRYRAAFVREPPIDLRARLDGKCRRSSVHEQGLRLCN